MSSDSPNTPREKLEARITALLLGELGSAESEELRAAIAKDPGLTKLHDQLEQTVSLVREAETSDSEEAQAGNEPLRLSDKRRESLLTHFKTVAPKEYQEPLRTSSGIRLLEIAAVLAIVSILAVMLLPTLGKAKSKAQSTAVLSNLRQIEIAKEIWATENNKSPDDVPTAQDLAPYLGRGGSEQLPKPVMGEKYVLGKVSEPVTAEVEARVARDKLRNLATEIRTMNGRPLARITLGDGGAGSSTFSLSNSEKPKNRPYGVTPLSGQSDSRRESEAVSNPAKYALATDITDALSELDSRGGAPPASSQSVRGGNTTIALPASGQGLVKQGGWNGGAGGIGETEVTDESGFTNTLAHNKKGFSLLGPSDVPAPTESAGYALNQGVGTAWGASASLRGIYDDQKRFGAFVGGDVGGVIARPESGTQQSADQRALGFDWYLGNETAGEVAANQPDVGFLGDADWIGVLEPTDQPHSSENQFVSRFAYLSPGTTNTLDLPALNDYSGNSGGNENSDGAGLITSGLRNTVTDLSEPDESAQTSRPSSDRFYAGLPIEPYTGLPARESSIARRSGGRVAEGGRQSNLLADARVETFSGRQSTAAPGLVTRTIDVDSDALRNRLKGIGMLPTAASMPEAAGKDGANEVARGGALATPRVAVAGAVGGGGIGGGGAAGLQFVTASNSNQELQGAVHDLFDTAGVDLNEGDGRAVFYNDREGKLMVRATPEEVKTIEAAAEVLKEEPSNVKLQTKLVDTSTAWQEQKQPLLEGRSGGAVQGETVTGDDILFAGERSNTIPESGVKDIPDTTFDLGITDQPEQRFDQLAPLSAKSSRGLNERQLIDGIERPSNLGEIEELGVNRLRGRELTDAAGKTPASPAFADAKQELERQLQLRETLALKVATESVDKNLPRSANVRIVEMAAVENGRKPTLGERFGRAFGGEVERSARIKLENGITDTPIDETLAARSYDPYFVQSEFESIQSEAVLGKVVDELGLERKWARKEGVETLSKADAIKVLRKRLDLEPVRNTSLIDINARDEEPEEAARIANAVAEAYADYRQSQRAVLYASESKVLREELAQQEKLVAQAREKLERVGKETTSNASNEDLPSRRRAPDAPIPQPEVLTRDNAFSTFSMNVSDVSFKLAAASLEAGRMPEPATVRSEEFINAFDYRDPQPAPGAPLAFAWERARYPFAHNRDLLRFSIQTAARGREPGRPLNLVLLLDNSGSMERADRIRIIEACLRVLAGQLTPRDKLSVVAFSRTARLWVDGVSGDQAGSAADQISELTPQGGTNLEEAMNLAYATALRHYLANGANRVVLLTDGAANLGNIDPEALKQTVESHRKQGIALDGFGIGWEGYNDDLLEVLSRNGDGRYGFVNTPAEAATEFAGQLAGALQVAASDVKVQVEFNPKRITSHRQVGYAKHQLTKEQFRDNTVDAAEIAAAESGNALYTVEVNAGGEGPIGVVRVRYKVPSTGRYHEHEWTVPYNGAAVSLDQARPTMRLAATASAFSEWLVASPFAAEVTPDALLEYLRGVPGVYGADTRPKKLEWMIRQAKSIAGQ